MSVRDFFAWLAEHRGCSVRSLASALERDPSTLVRSSTEVRPATARRWEVALALTEVEREALARIVRGRRPSPLRAWGVAQRRGWSIAELAAACGLSEYVAGCWIRGVRRSSGGFYLPAAAWDDRIAAACGSDVLTETWEDDCHAAAAYWRETRGRMAVASWGAACGGAECQTAA